MSSICVSMFLSLLRSIGAYGNCYRALGLDERDSLLLYKQPTMPLFSHLHCLSRAIVTIQRADRKHALHAESCSKFQVLPSK
ncbi:hypothetical protein KXD40_009548 [Peronospora effusa]|uniref:Secreted protein n=1 Tax=Peronospora effusa TaxID=542832 RepID=A0A3M6VAX3_9STRA|nr:hypothetical protein DD238_007704 [Peronospora effusa]RQM09344.1 hypothetical protein DD237_005992 [Peronospora effusa]UIZ23770.1 hypothetical protein KXD40_009548 [Peronospora effusa]